MSELSITLEPGPWPDEQYTDCWPVEGRIAGTVRLDAPQPMRARRVVVELEWHTEGRGDRDRAAVGKVEVHTGDIPEGEHAWPFSFSVPPEGPISYHGHLIQILWVVRATIDIPWARDRKTEYPLTVLPDYDTAG